MNRFPDRERITAMLGLAALATLMEMACALSFFIDTPGSLLA